MTKQNHSRLFPFEEDLEDYLEVHLSLPGQDLLIVGRQVKTVAGPIDLLAIDSVGVIYIIELKRALARPSAVGQVLSYRRSLKRLNRDEIIRIVESGLRKNNLMESFQRHFGHPLPEKLNETQKLVIIAGSLHAHTTDSILELSEEEYPAPVTAFTYVRRSDTVILTPWGHRSQDVNEGSHAGTIPSVRSKLIDVLAKRWKRRRAVDEDMQRFWLANEQDFGPFVTFSFIFDRYEEWVRIQPNSSVRLRNKGSVGEQVRAITAESDEWSRVWVARRNDMDVYNTFTVPPSVRTYRALNHSVVAYQRSPI